MICVPSEKVRAEPGRYAGLLIGSVFVYPTDTIYGIGCDATNPSLVSRIREIKERKDAPFSVIAPSKEWIRASCHMHPEAEAWLEKLPGPYTLILRQKKKGAVAGNTSFSDTIGVRIPGSWFSQIVSLMGLPVVTTSANVHGRPHMTSLDDIDSRIRDMVDYIIYEGPIAGHPSAIIDLTNEKAEIKERKK